MEDVQRDIDKSLAKIDNLMQELQHYKKKYEKDNNINYISITPYIDASILDNKNNNIEKIVNKTYEIETNNTNASINTHMPNKYYNSYILLGLCTIINAGFVIYTINSIVSNF